MMADGPSLLRFFLVVSPLPPLMHRTFVVLVVGAAGVIALDVNRTRDVLVPLLALHLFAASSGFAGPARRGYYDQLLTRGDGRLAIAFAHWALSIAPGLAAGLAIALVEAVARRGFPQHTLAAGTVAAMAVVSMLAWSLTVALPRFSGAIGWMVTLIAAASVWPLERVSTPALTALATVVNPATLIGRSLDGAAWLVVAPAIAAGASAMVVACTWVVLTDYPLEASQ